MIRILMFTVATLWLTACSANNCPCGEYSDGFGNCHWREWFIDTRPHCQRMYQPVPCPWPEKDGKCEPPKKKAKSETR